MLQETNSNNFSKLIQRVNDIIQCSQKHLDQEGIKQILKDQSKSIKTEPSYKDNLEDQPTKVKRQVSKESFHTPSQYESQCVEYFFNNFDKFIKVNYEPTNYTKTNPNSIKRSLNQCFEQCKQIESNNDIKEKTPTISTNISQLLKKKNSYLQQQQQQQSYRTITPQPFNTTRAQTQKDVEIHIPQRSNVLNNITRALMDQQKTCQNQNFLKNQSFTQKNSDSSNQINILKNLNFQNFKDKIEFNKNNSIKRVSNTCHTQEDANFIDSNTNLIKTQTTQIQQVVQKQSVSTEKVHQEKQQKSQSFHHQKNTTLNSQNSQKPNINFEFLTNFQKDYNNLQSLMQTSNQTSHANIPKTNKYKTKKLTNISKFDMNNKENNQDFINRPRVQTVMAGKVQTERDGLNNKDGGIFFQQQALLQGKMMNKDKALLTVKNRSQSVQRNNFGNNVVKKKQQNTNNFINNK